MAANVHVRIKIALTSISEAKEDTATIALSAAVVYSALYICERAMWTLAAREQQFKSQFIQYAMEKLPDLEFPLTLGIRQQIHRELTTMLGVACGTVEATSDELKIDINKMDDEIAERDLLIIKQSRKQLIKAEEKHK